jgi:hypothetical protein
MSGAAVEARDASWTAEIGAALEALEERGAQIATFTGARIREEYPTYATVDETSLTASARRNVDRGIQVIRERRRATRDELELHARVAEERAHERVPVEDTLSAFGLAMGILRDEFLAIGENVGADPRSVLEATQLLWGLAEDITVQLAVVHRDAELTIARRDERQRAEFLRHLLLGSLNGPELHRHAAAYGLQLGQVYHAIRARPSGDTTLSDLRRAVEQAGGSAGRHALVGILEGDVAGVVSRHPGALALDALIGVGPPAGLAAMEPSYATASRIVEVAECFRMTGTHTLADVSIRAAVADEAEVGDLLLERYLEPLDTGGDFGAVLAETLRAYLANGLRLKQTARVLNVHANTLRYRVRRFEELTGTELGDTETLFQVWWALEWSRIRDRRGGQIAAEPDM